MPATRRSTRSAAAKAAGGKQSTLSFNNRVTKPSASKATGKDVITSPSSSHHTVKVDVKKKEEEVEEVEEEEEEEEEEEQLEQEEEEDKVVVVKKPEAEIQAEKITDARIKKYWRDVEAARIAKRVHQEELTLAEKVLRYFDISSQYGPSIGVTRIKRWHRAERLGLNPPIEVLAVLLKEENQGNADIERSAMDRIMGSTAIGSV